MSASIASAQTEPDVCRAVVDGLHDEAIGYDFISVFLLDASTGERVLGASVGWDDIPPGMRIPAGVSDVVQRVLAKDPADRTASAADLARVLTQLG